MLQADGGRADLASVQSDLDPRRVLGALLRGAEVCCGRGEQHRELLVDVEVSGGQLHVDGRLVVPREHSEQSLRSVSSWRPNHGVLSPTKHIAKPPSRLRQGERGRSAGAIKAAATANDRCVHRGAELGFLRTQQRQRRLLARQAVAAKDGIEEAVIPMIRLFQDASGEAIPMDNIQEVLGKIRLAKPPPQKTPDEAEAVGFAHHRQASESERCVVRLGGPQLPPDPCVCGGNRYAMLGERPDEIRQRPSSEHLNREVLGQLGVAVDKVGDAQGCEFGQQVADPKMVGDKGRVNQQAGRKPGRTTVHPIDQPL
mmetsp:Transcript_107027/g.307889  ORF Transcript_107027/g.307889 Transcript_107027/m.307889 type:complete len:313 (-) Transcript_107027:291-1229(-)